MRRFLAGLQARIRSLFRRSSADRDMDAEIEFHLSMETEKNVRDGMSPEEARRAALASFGGVEQHRQEMRDQRRAPFFEAFFREIRYALRAALRAPTFSLIAIATVGLGVGATTSVFTIADQLFFTGLAVPDSHQLVSWVEDRSGRTSTGLEGMRLSFERYEAYAAGTTSVFEGVATHALEDVALRLSDGTVPARATLTSGNYFPLLRVNPVEGRAYFDVRALEVVISQRLKRQHFGSRSPLGELVHIDGHPFTIVGVAPENFRGSVPLTRPDIWIPYHAARRSDGTPWYTGWGGLLGRLQPDASLDQAQSVVETLALTQPLDEGTTEVRGATVYRVSGLPRMDEVVGVFAFVGVLLAMAGVLLLIASANLASMLMARAIQRRRELAIRLAIGSGARRLLRQLLAESMVLFGAGGAVGVGLAFVLTDRMAMINLPPQVGFDLALRPDGSVLVFALVVTIATGLAFSLLPALQAARPDLVPALRDGGGAGVRRASKVRNVFVTGQVAMAAMLLIVASLLGRTFQKGLNADLGFRSEGLWVATTNLSLEGHDEESGRRFYAELLRQTEELDGVQAAALAQVLPLNGDRESNGMRPEIAPGEEEVFISVSRNIVTPTFFETLEIPFVDGRGFQSSDAAGAPRVVIINETLAARFWPDRTAVGQVIYMGDTPLEVVGVVADAKYQFVMEAQLPFAYFPFSQSYGGRMTLHARAPSNGAEAQERIRDIVRTLDANVAIESDGPLEEVISFSLFAHRFAATMIGAFGLSGMLLAVLGVYGVLSFQVAQRTREFGIRRALGADPKRVVLDVVRAGLTLASVGCVIGLFAGGAVAQLLGSLMVGLDPLDPVTFAVVPLTLLGVGLIASLVPGVRATTVEAVVALRDG